MSEDNGWGYIIIWNKRTIRIPLLFVGPYCDVFSKSVIHP